MLNNNLKKKKVLLVIPLPPPYYGSALSSQACLKLLHRDPRFEISTIKINYSKEINDLGKFSFSKLIGFISATRSIIYHCCKYKPDIVYHVPATAGLAFWRDIIFCLLIKILNKKIIFHLRTRINSKEKLVYVKFVLFKYVFSSNKLIILGKELVKDLDGLINNKDIIILPNAIEQNISAKNYALISNKRNTPSTTLKLLFLSNMIKAKGWVLVLESAMLLKNSGTNFECTFAGDWQSAADQKEFFNFIKKNDLLNEIKFLGFVDHIQKDHLLSNSDILIFPTQYKLETFGRVIIEAMEYGIPVIANGIGTIPSIIDHCQTGFVLEKNSPDEIVNYINLLTDSDTRKKIGNNARQKFLNEFTIDVFKKKFLSIIYESFD